MALGWLAGDDGGAMVAAASGGFAKVEPQAGFAMLFVGPVAAEAMLGEDRQDFAAKAGSLPNCVGRLQGRGEQQACTPSWDHGAKLAQRARGRNLDFTASSARGCLAAPVR